MNQLTYKSSQASTKIVFGSGLAPSYRESDLSRTVIITDSNVRKLYGRMFPGCPVIAVKPGEESKGLITIENIVGELLRLQADRSWFILGIGGGVVCDIAGFVASVYMRGARFGFIASTLLAQVDASVGGKNGVNSHGFKNIIGTFNQPEFVYCDPAMLDTLPGEELLSGMGELVKHAIIGDAGLFGLIEERVLSGHGKGRVPDAELIRQSVEVKLRIVEADERERGERRLLNLGHTIGHAIESVTGTKHGLAISAGIWFAARLSLERGYLNESDYHRITGLLDAMGLASNPLMRPEYIDAVLKDKKRDGDSIHFVFVDAPGVAVARPLPLRELTKWMRDKVK